MHQVVRTRLAGPGMSRAYSRHPDEGRSPHAEMKATSPEQFPAPPSSRFPSGAALDGSHSITAPRRWGVGGWAPPIKKHFFCGVYGYDHFFFFFFFFFVFFFGCECVCRHQVCIFCIPNEKLKYCFFFFFFFFFFWGGGGGLMVW